MQINAIKEYESCKNLKFGNWSRVVYKDIETIERTWNKDFVKLDIIQHRNDTEFFRNGAEIPYMLDRVVKAFKHKKHVNVYCYGCSDGSEPYTMVMYLYAKYGEKIADKFMPIIAKDYDLSAILKARSGVFEIDKEEYKNIQNFTKFNFKKFFNTISPQMMDNEESRIIAKANPKYYSKIKYGVGNILQDYKNIDGKTTLLTTRNFLPYLHEHSRIELAPKIASILRNGSFWNIGTYDKFNCPDIIRGMLSSGFVEQSKNLYKKNKLDFKEIIYDIKKIYKYEMLDYLTARKQRL